MYKKNLRKKFLIDRTMQIHLAIRLIGYWTGMWLLIFGLPFVGLIIFRAATTELGIVELSARIVEDFWFPAITSMLALPIVARDSIRFSHRIAGPIFRLEREMKNLAENGHAEEVHPRNGDYCTGVASEFNRILQRFGRQDQTS